ncbi:uroporphyrinogen-III C-methyltransferase [Leptothrix cholodnii]|nr:uroporphyrinogen-III C-methyltransferase [Leptothrix cholodnii]
MASTAAAGARAPAMLVMALVAVVLAATAVWMTWDTRTQLHSLEQELVRRQQGSADQSAEALVLARQAQEVSRDSAAKAALLEARLAEVALQRGQLDDLIQSLSRSRDENVVADIEAAIRVAMQQSALTGSAEPLVVALRSADDRLARINQPRLERLRRAIASDLDRVRSVGVPDIGALLIKIDEVVRLADELPLVSEAAITGRHAGEARAIPAGTASAPVASATVPRKGSAASAQAASAGASSPVWMLAWSRPFDEIWSELRSLLRVTRIERPEAMLIAPEQGFLLRENLKLRLLNARLSVLSRQLDAASADLQSAQQAINRYFDASSRKTQVAVELLRQIAQQSRLIGVPKPDETLVATAAAVAGR